MRTRAFSVKKLLSLVLAFAMIISMILPTSVLALPGYDVEISYAFVCLAEVGEGETQIPQLRISFNKDIVVADDWATKITVTGKETENIFGDNAELKTEQNKSLFIVNLGSDYKIAAGDEINFNGAITAFDEEDNSLTVEESTVLGGALQLVTVEQGVVTPAEATVTLKNYDSFPAELGYGTFDVIYECDGYMAKEAGFAITQSEIESGTYTLDDITLDKLADFTSLNAVLVEGKAIVDGGETEKAKYTSSSYDAFITAYDEAIAIDQETTLEAAQDDVDVKAYALENAIANLVETRVVKFNAVAVASDVTVNYAKADKVYLVFDEPIAEDADIISKLTINDEDAADYLENADWIDNTIYVMDIKSNMNNGAVIKFLGDENIKAVAGHALKEYSTTILGNLEEVTDEVIADSMVATIVKCSDKPGVVAGDKIVLVFDAPVYGKPDTINVNDNAFTAVKKDGTDNTVYVITLEDNASITESTIIEFGSMTSALNGSFGEKVAPKVLKAVIVDNDGTASTEGDSIIIYFDRNTNCSTTGTLTGNLYGAEYEWINAQTLKITLGDAEIYADDEIDISTIAIKDYYETVDATGLTNITLEGGFGHAIKPEVSRVTAVSVTGKPVASQGDKIVIAFNTLVNHDEVTDISVNGGNLGNDFRIDWTDKQTSVAVITLGAGDSTDVQIGTTSIRFVGDIWDVTHTVKMTQQDFRIKNGAWGVSITPELMSATIVKVKAAPEAQKGDKIVFVFTTPTNGEEDIVSLFGNKFGSNATGYWTNNNTIYTIELGEGATIDDGEEIDFVNDGTLKDMYGFEKVDNRSDVSLNGSFGNANKPELLSATIVKTSVIPGAQKGDKIIFVFSAMTNGSGATPDIIGSLSDKFGNNARGEWSANGTIYTVELGESPEVADNAEITLQSNSELKDVHNKVAVEGGKKVTLEGTFGKEIVQELQVSSVIAYSEGSKNKVKVIFNVETNLPTVATTSFKTALGEANKVDDKCIFGEAFEINVTAQELIITLDNTGYSITDTTILNLDGLGIKSVSGGDLTGSIPECDGYFVPVVENVVVQDDGVTVVIYFSARTDGNTDAAKAAVLAQKALFGSTAYQNVEWKNNNTELHITMSDDNTMADDAYIVLNDFEIYDEFSKTHKVVGQYNVDTEKLDYKTLTFTVYANAINTENAAREDVTKAMDGDELVIEFSRATNKPDNMFDNLALENAEDTFGEGATAVWSSDKKLIVTLGTGSVVSTSSKIIVKNVKFANGTGKLSQVDADVSDAVSITGKFDGREYWIDSAVKTVANGRTRVAVSLTKSALSTDATNVFVVCQAYDSNNTVQTISAIGVPDKATNSFIFDFNATNLAVFDVVVLKGDYSDINAGVDVYSDTVKPTTAE